MIGLTSFFDGARQLAEFGRNFVDPGAKRAEDTTGASSEPQEGAEAQDASLVGGIIGMTRDRISACGKGLVSLARRSRILERVDSGKLPPLVDDTSTNSYLVNTIVDYLDSDMASDTPLAGMIDNVVGLCFENDVHPDNLATLLKDEALLAVLVDEVINHAFDNTRFRGVNLVALATTLPAALAVKVKSKLHRTLFLKPVKGSPVEKDLDKLLSGYVKIYDPKNPKFSLTSFFNAMVEKYQGNGQEQDSYDILGWLKTHKTSLVTMLGGEIDQLAKEAYRECGRRNPEKFIGIFLGDFIYEQPGGVGGKSTWALNDEQLRKFVADVLPQIVTDADDMRELFLKLTDLANKTIPHTIEQSRVEHVVRHEKGGESVVTDTVLTESPSRTAKEFLMSKLAKRADTSLQRVDLLNLLSAPTESPKELLEKFDAWFEKKEIQYSPETDKNKTSYELREALATEAEKQYFDKTVKITEAEDSSFTIKFLKFNEKAYKVYIKRLFGKRKAPTSGRAEAINVIEKRIESSFQDINKALENMGDLLQVDLTLCEDVKNCNDLAELIVYACSGSDELVRWEARRKIELYINKYHCDMVARRVFAESDAESIDEALKNDFRFTGETERVYFSEGDATSGVRIVNSPSEEAKEGLQSFELEVAEFKPNGEDVKSQFTVGFLLPVTPNNSKNAPAYINYKSWIQALFKSIRKNALPEFIQDNLRITMVGKNESELKAIAGFIDRSIATWGLRVDYENSYETSDPIRKNSSTGEGYKHIKWVIYVPASDKKNNENFLTLLEIRLATRDTIARERSSTDTASHATYTRTRAVRDLLGKLLPPDIAEYRDKYYELDTNPALALLGQKQYIFTPPAEVQN